MLTVTFTKNQESRIEKELSELILKAMFSKVLLLMRMKFYPLRHLKHPLPLKSSFEIFKKICKSLTKILQKLPGGHR